MALVEVDEKYGDSAFPPTDDAPLDASSVVHLVLTMDPEMRRPIGDVGSPTYWQFVRAQLHVLAAHCADDVTVYWTIIGQPMRQTTMCCISLSADTLSPPEKYANTNYDDLGSTPYGAVYAMEQTALLSQKQPVTLIIMAHGAMTARRGGFPVPYLESDPRGVCGAVLDRCREVLAARPVLVYGMGFKQDMWWPQVLGLAAAGPYMMHPFQLIQPTTTLEGAGVQLRDFLTGPRRLYAARDRMGGRDHSTARTKYGWGRQWQYQPFVAAVADENVPPHMPRFLRLYVQLTRGAPFLPRVALEDLRDEIGKCSNSDMRSAALALLEQLLPLAVRYGLRLERPWK